MADVGLVDLDTWAGGVPYDAFDTLRDAGPVQRHANSAGRDFWAVTGHAELVEASRDTARFLCTLNNSASDQYPVGAEPDEIGRAMMNQMHMMNGTDHTRLRGLVSRAFTSRVIARLEDSTRELARSIVARVADKDEFDFVHEISAELPLSVICDLMGIPDADKPLIFELTNRMMGPGDPEYSASVEDARSAVSELYAYAAELAVERRKKPGSDLTSLLLQAELDGEKLTDAEYLAFFQLLSAAGNETTRNLISHGMLALIEHPDQRAELREDRSLIPRAVEEMLRWGTPVIHFARDAAQDTVLGGQQIAAGDKIVLWYIAANRDPAVFRDPYRFDIKRDPNPHVAFGGGGPHFCLGASLARMEARVMFEELFTLLPDLELAGQASLMRSNMFHSIKHLPVRHETG
ncbi:cytochrome P450 [Streptomyces sp. NPDC057363]|uniref:cytochrome P450 n=1 Tax=Streptomyces sp. NPDC057363 TaxID=3346107 RepID=UPI00362F3A97